MATTVTAPIATALARGRRRNAAAILATTTMTLLSLLTTMPLPASAQHTDHGGHSSSAMPMSAANGPRPACVEDPTTADCASFRLPHRTFQSDLNSLCTAMHFMVGCSIYKACRAQMPGVDATEGPWTAKVGSAPAVCRRLPLIATVCTWDEGMGRMAGCQANFNSLCGTKGTVVEVCKNYTGFSELPTTKMLNAAVKEMCTEDRKRPGCGKCMASFDANKTWGSCDLLGTWGDICVAEPKHKHCAYHKELCTKEDPSWFFCKGGATAATTAGWALLNATSLNATYMATVPPPAAPMPGAAMPGGAAATTTATTAAAPKAAPGAGAARALKSSPSSAAADRPAAAAAATAAKPAASAAAPRSVAAAIVAAAFASAVVVA